MTSKNKEGLKKGKKSNFVKGYEWNNAFFSYLYDLGELVK